MERGTRNARNANLTGQMPQQTYGQSPASGPAPTTAGHHKHDMINKLDPRVDSTHDRQPLSTATGDIPKGTYGPHSSRLANALDPRVDSDLDSTRTGAGMGAGGGRAGGASAAAGPSMMHGGAGYGAGHPTAAGGLSGNRGAPEGTYGPHRTRVGNAMDPRVDSDLDSGQRATMGRSGVGAAAAGGSLGGGAPGAGMTSSTTSAGTGVPGTRTTGPHQSNVANKLDPRVDSKTGTWKA